MMELFKRVAMASLIIFLMGSSAMSYSTSNIFESDQSDYKILIFLSRSCPCSRSHVEHLNSLEKKYKNVSLYGVITDIFDKESKVDIDRYYAQKNFVFPIIVDESQSLVKKYKALKTPHAVLLRRVENGSYKVIYQGGVTDKRDFSRSRKKYLSENLEALIHGKSVKYAQGKSLGCYIRRL